MTHSAARCAFPNWLALVPCLTLLSGCVFTTTSSKILETSGPVSTRLRLSRPAASALSGTFRQEGHSLVGTVVFTKECAVETTRTTLRHESTTTEPNRKTSVAWILTGVGLSTLGMGLLAASSQQSESVSCGDGGPVESGDRCDSQSGASFHAGLTFLGLGLGAGVLGLVNSKKPTHVETRELAPARASQVSPDVACGSASDLEGMTVMVDVPEAGRWFGTVAGDGSVRIDLNPALRIVGSDVPVVVDVVPAGLDGLIDRGAHDYGVAVQARTKWCAAPRGFDDEDVEKRGNGLSQSTIRALWRIGGGP